MTWYKKGLYFKCLKCGRCCSSFPGYVWLTDKEIEKISNFLNISKEKFIKKYTRQINNRLSLKENFTNFDCCLLKDKKCLIYSQRPKQCRSFPWWRENLISKQAWDNTEKQCPGINNKSGELFTFEKIQALLSE